MARGVVGRKLGMTRIFRDDGVSIPVSVIHVEPNRVTQVKTDAVDGYRALQVTTGSRKSSRLNKPMAGHFAKVGVVAGWGLWELPLDVEHQAEFQVGSEIKADLFQVGQMVDVKGISKGKGYAGTIKRHNFKSQDNTHGNSVSHRAPGSIGQCQTPGRVFKGKKMAGHLGNVRVTQQNLEIVKVDSERNLLMIKGAVPGSRGGDVIVSSSVKSKA